MCHNPPPPPPQSYLGKLHQGMKTSSDFQDQGAENESSEMLHPAEMKRQAQGAALRLVPHPQTSPPQRPCLFLLTDVQ